jgi:DNA-binding MarR family transcriptional regulator
MTMATERLSRLQHRILAWLLAENQRLRGMIAAAHQDLVRAMVAQGFDKGNVSTSLKGLEAKGLVTITRPPGAVRCQTHRHTATWEDLHGQLNPKTHQ